MAFFGIIPPFQDQLAKRLDFIINDCLIDNFRYQLHRNRLMRMFNSRIKHLFRGSFWNHLNACNLSIKSYLNN